MTAGLPIGQVRFRNEKLMKGSTIMMKTRGIGRLVATGVGVLMLSGVGVMAFAEDVDTEGVELSVAIAPLADPGALTLEVATAAATLTEVTSTQPGVRSFTGLLPEVTVNDTRTEAPSDKAWALNAQVTDFTGPGGATISRANLGW